MTLKANGDSCFMCNYYLVILYYANFKYIIFFKIVWSAKLFFLILIP